MVNVRTRKQVSEQNISFAKLGCEECEECLEFEHHPYSENDGGCDICASHELHLVASKDSRDAYRFDSAKANTNEESYFSVDLQKVVMLPRLPGVKTVVFPKRIVVYKHSLLLEIRK